MRHGRLGIIGAALLGAACGGGDSPAEPDAAPQSCTFSLAFEEGDDGHADPLGAVPGQARAGRVGDGVLPPLSEGLAWWRPGDFVLANDRVALVIEDVGPSDGYDPWGGRPVGAARIRDGAMIEPALFNEMLLLTNRESVVTTSVTVLADGSDGGDAVVRAHGILAPTPFFENIVGGLFRETHGDIPTAIDYVLSPDSDHVDVYFVHNSPRQVPAEVGVQLHGWLYGYRMPGYAPGLGFDTEGEDVPYLAFIDDDATSYAYARTDSELRAAVAASGFISNFAGSFTIEPCARTTRHHARLTIGGPGLDGLRQAVARSQGETLRALTGTVTNADATPAEGVRVHVEATDGSYLTRARTDATGAYAVHVPGGQDVRVTAYRRGDEVVGPVDVAAADETADLQLAPTGWIGVTAVDADGGGALPARIQVLPTTQAVPSVPGHFGEPRTVSGRLHVEYAIDGTATVRAPVGDWEVVVSRGFEYEIHREVVSVTAGETVEVAASLPRVVDTTGVMCADYHIHTVRSADSDDMGELKLRSAAADGLELPIRSEHEFVEDFQPLVEQLGLTAWMRGMTSVEMTSMEIWGHMGVFPLEPDPTAVNGGTPLWERFPTTEDPTVPVEIMSPVEVFQQVRQRPEQPIVIINHPRGTANYFDYVGYDNVTGMVDFPEFWDEEFRVVEVFNGSGWLGNKDGTVADWLSFLRDGRRVFAVGSSDSHGVAGSPVGYPRTCLQLGTDDPNAVTTTAVRDATHNGHAVVVGGIFLDVSIGEAGPGDDVTVGGPTATVHIRVQAPSWVTADFLDIVVDGQIVDTISILPGDADAENPVIRWEGDVEVTVDDGALGSFVIVAAYGNGTLEPVHRGERPFAVSNPIFVGR